MTRRLSEILTIRSDFNFFKSIADLEPFDLDRLEAVIDGLIEYLDQVEGIFKHLQSFEIDVMTNIEWASEGNIKFYEIFRNVDSIDSIVLQALNLLENNLETDSEIANCGVFDKLDRLSETSLMLKQDHLLRFKSRVDIAVEHNEIYNITMNTINQELEHCLKKCFKIHEKRFSSPVRHAPSFNLDMLTKKLLQQRSNLRLPLLNELDNELYEEYLELKAIVDPLKASLSFIPHRIEDFKNKYPDIDLIYVSRLNEKYNSLVTELDYLQNEVKDLKYDLVDSRWNEIFSYLNTEMSFLISGVEKELKKIEHLRDEQSNFRAQVFKRLKYTTEIVENTFTLINQAIDEDLIELKVTERSNELAEAWLNIKTKIPQGYLEKIENDEKQLESDGDITKAFKTLVLDDTKPDDNPGVTSTREKRRTRAGQYLVGKMNLVPVLVEGDPTSVRKPEENISYSRNVLTESLKQNQLDISPSKSKASTASANRLKAIPPLRSDLAAELNFLDDESSSRDYELTDSSSKVFDHPITDINESNASQVHQDTLNMLEAKSDADVFSTPVKHSRTIDPTISATPKISVNPQLSFQSKIPMPEKIQSRIPRPVSRAGFNERPNSRLATARSASSLGSRHMIDRPASALASSRSERPHSRGPATLNRHSMIPQTPVRSSNIHGSTRRRSLLPQPTPIKEIMEIRSESRLSGRLSALGTRPVYNDRPAKPIWK